MSLELGRRLLVSGAIGSTDLNAALVVHLRSGQPLVSVLLDWGVVSPDLLEQELARSSPQALDVVVPSSELFHALPAGLCRALWALPIREDPRVPTVEVAAVEPSDGHVKQEFAFQFGRAVRLIRARAPAILAALDRMEGLDSVRANRGGRSASKGPDMRSTHRRDPKPFLDAIGAATDRDAVIRDLVAAMSTVARRVGVFIVRREGLRGLACNAAFANEADFRNIVVVGDRSNVLGQAMREGTYVGRLPETPAHRGLRELLSAGEGDVLVHPVHVAGRIALLLVTNQMEDVVLAQRLAEDLEYAAAMALTRILATRKTPR